MLKKGENILLATYIMSDIHGEYDLYKKMKDKIQFNTQTDTLYIIGDIADRGYDGVRIYKDILEYRKSIFMLRGNHDQMLLDTFKSKRESDRKLWINCGGIETLHSVLHLEIEEREEILKLIEDSPTFIELQVGENKFHLVHGKPSFEDYSRIWGRIDFNADYSDIVGDRTIVFGHTPVWHYSRNYKEKASIIHKNNMICIDCGSGHKFNMARLACLRLDDFEEFYVDYD